MDKFFEDYLHLLETCHNDIVHALTGLSEDALDWQPGPEMNSIAVLIYHLTGAERYWIGDVVDQTPSGRDRDGEFKVYNIGVDVLKHRLQENVEYARKVAEKLSLMDLNATRLSPRDGRTVTVAWALMHALEHSSVHLGQIEITRRLREQARARSASTQ